MHGAPRESRCHSRRSPRSHRSERSYSPRYDSRGEPRRESRVTERYDRHRRETPPRGRSRSSERRDRSPMPPRRGWGARSRNSQSLGRRPVQTRTRHRSRERSPRERSRRYRHRRYDSSREPARHRDGAHLRLRSRSPRTNSPTVHRYRSDRSRSWSHSPPRRRRDRSYSPVAYEQSSRVRSRPPEVRSPSQRQRHGRLNHDTSSRRRSDSPSTRTSNVRSIGSSERQGLHSQLDSEPRFGRRRNKNTAQSRRPPVGPVVDPIAEYGGNRAKAVAPLSTDMVGQIPLLGQSARSQIVPKSFVFKTRPEQTAGVHLVGFEKSTIGQTTLPILECPQPRHIGLSESGPVPISWQDAGDSNQLQLEAVKSMNVQGQIALSHSQESMRRELQNHLSQTYSVFAQTNQHFAVMGEQLASYRATVFREAQAVLRQRQALLEEQQALYQEQQDFQSKLQALQQVTENVIHSTLDVRADDRQGSAHSVSQVDVEMEDQQNSSLPPAPASTHTLDALEDARLKYRKYLERLRDEAKSFYQKEVAAFGNLGHSLTETLETLKGNTGPEVFNFPAVQQAESQILLKAPSLGEKAFELYNNHHQKILDALQTEAEMADIECNADTICSGPDTLVVQLNSIRAERDRLLTPLKRELGDLLFELIAAVAAAPWERAPQDPLAVMVPVFNAFGIGVRRSPNCGVDLLIRTEDQHAVAAQIQPTNYESRVQIAQTMVVTPDQPLQMMRAPSTIVTKAHMAESSAVQATPGAGFACPYGAISRNETSKPA